MSVEICFEYVVKFEHELNVIISLFSVNICSISTGTFRAGSSTSEIELKVNCIASNNLG